MQITIALNVSAAVTADYTVASQSDLNTALSTATTGEIIEFVAGAQDGQFTYSTARDLSGVTMRSASGVTIEKLDLDSIDNLTLDGLNFAWNNRAGSDFGVGGDPKYCLVLNNLTGFIARNCSFDCDPTGGSGKQTIAIRAKRMGGIRSTSADGEIDTCTFTRVRDGMVMKSGDWNIHDCAGSQIYEDFITGDATNWTVDDNTATLFEGSYVRNYTISSITGTLAVGDVFTSGNKVIEIHAVSGTDLDGIINNYTLPSASNVFSGTGAAAGKSFTVSTDSGEVPGLNIHGDGFQPLLLTGSAKKRLTMRRNFFHRSLAQVTDAISQEPLTQGALAQRNGGTGGWQVFTMTHNVITVGQPYGLKVQQAEDGALSYNTVIWAEIGIRSDIEIDGFTNMTVEYNAGDNNSGGVIDDNGGNTSTTIANNVFVDGNNGDQETVYVDPFVYPQTLANLAPVAGQAVDTGGAGALTTAGAFR